MIVSMPFKCYDCQQDLFATSDNTQGIITDHDYAEALRVHRTTSCPIWLDVEAGIATVASSPSEFKISDILSDPEAQARYQQLTGKREEQAQVPVKYASSKRIKFQRAPKREQNGNQL